MTTSTAGPVPHAQAADDPALDHQASSARREVLRYLRPGPRAGTALLLVLAASTTLPLIAPQVTRRFVDDAIGGATTIRLISIAAVYLAVAVTAQAARVLTAWLASRLAWDGTNRLRERLTEHALSLDMAFHGKHTPGEMIERVDGDVVAVSDFIVAFLLDVVVSVLLLGGVLVLVLTVDLRIGTVLFVYCLAMGTAMVRSQRLTVATARFDREQEAALYGYLEERLSGMEDLRANGAGAHTVRRFHQVAGRLHRADVQAGKRSTVLVAGTSVAFAAGTALILALATLGRHSDAISVGTAVLLFQYAQMVRTPFERLIGQLQQYQGALGSFARMGDLLGEQSTMRPPRQPRQLPASGPLSLQLDRVSFAYPDDGETVLTDVNLDLAPGETLGLVGRTGAGKTTLARLVLRLYDPIAGTVRVGGVDLRQADAKSVCQRVGMVTQDIQIFAASVRDNLTLFRSDIDDGVLHAVLAEVGLTDWLRDMPAGLDTRLSGPGGGLSAGEAQLLAFARAFLDDPGLVVLDEASSRLDPATERRVGDAVRRLLSRRTGVLIAHRLSSMSSVDKIAVVEDGQIAEFGRRTDLVADPGSRFGQLLDIAGVRR